MERKFVFALLVAGVLLLSAGCLGIGSESPRTDGGTAIFGGEELGPSAPGTASVPEGLTDSTGRMVVKTGSAEVQVPAGELEAHGAVSAQVPGAG